MIDTQTQTRCTILLESAEFRHALFRTSASLTPEPADVAEYFRDFQGIYFRDDFQGVRQLGYLHRQPGVGVDNRLVLLKDAQPSR